MSFLVSKTSEGTYMPTVAGFTLIVAVMLGSILLGNWLFNKKKGLNAKQIAFSSMALALATVASFIKFTKLPMGGSVTLFSMLFVVLIGYWFGLSTGIAAAISYGLLQLVIDPYIISFPQMITDYVLAFGALGLSGLFHGKKHGLVKGYIVGVLGRYFFAFLSGWIFFGSYASQMGYKTAYGYSLAYNGTYIIPEAALTAVILLVPAVQKGFATVKQMAVGEA